MRGAAAYNPWSNGTRARAWLKFFFSRLKASLLGRCQEVLDLVDVPAVRRALITARRERLRGASPQQVLSSLGPHS